MSVLPLDLERRFEQRWAASFSGVSQGQHRLEGQQQHQQLTAPDNSKRKIRRVESAGLRLPLPADVNRRARRRGTEAPRPFDSTFMVRGAGRVEVPLVGFPSACFCGSTKTCRSQERYYQNGIRVDARQPGGTL